MTTDDPTPRPPDGSAEPGTAEPSPAGRTTSQGAADSGEAPSGTGATAEGGPGQEFFDSVRRSGFFRGDDRWIGGVASGLARRIGVDPLVVRAAWIVLTLIAGIGLLLYAAAWAFLPDERDGRIHVQDVVRGKVDAAWVGIVVLVVLGLTAGSGTIGIFGFGTNGLGHALVTLLVVGVIVAIVVVAVRNRQSGPAASAPGMAPPPGSSHGPAQGAGPGSTTPTAAAPPAGPGAPSGTMPPAPVSPAAHGYAGPTYGHPMYGYPQAAPQPHLGVPGLAPEHRGAGQARTAAPVRTAPQQVRPIVRGPGGTALAIVVGLCMIGAAAVLVAHQADALDGPLALAIAGGVAVLAGGGVVISGLRGRRSGALGALALVALVAAGPLFAVSQIRGTSAEWSTSFDSVTWQPQDASQAAGGFQVSFADATIDLRATPFAPGTTVDVPVRTFASSVTVLVAPGTPVSADLSLVGAEVKWQVAPPETYDRFHHDLHLESQAVIDGTQPLIHLDVSGAASEIIIEES